MAERANRSLAEAFRALLMLYRQPDGSFALPQAIRGEDLLHLLHMALGDEVCVCEHAQDAIWEIARHMGYKVAASPVESAGDALAFLQEAGVKNADEWYRARGLSEETMHHLYAASCVIARNEQFWRKLIATPKLSSSNANDLVPFVIQAIDFSLSDEELSTDETVFMC